MTGDYRESHLDRGGIYDGNLEQEPFSRYMARREAEILCWFAHKHFRGKIPRYLDFACGTGRITSLMEEFAEESYGIDVSRSMVAVAERKCKKTQFSVVDITRQVPTLPCVDLITAFRFFGNAQDELRAGVLCALRQKLSQDGYLVFNNHRNPCAPINALSRSEPLDLSGSKMRRLLRENGFRIARVYGVGGWIFRHRIMANAALLDSRLARVLETVSLLPRVGFWCPDMVVVARRA